MRNPGWIDLQVNGCSGIDFSSPELTGDDFLRAAERVLESGTGCFLPTLITSPFGLYRRNLGVIRRAVVRHGLEREVPGVHLEGPFISADPGAAGAHNPDWVVPPGPEKVEALLDLEPGFVRLVTLGADAENAAGAVRLLRSRGVAVSVGHHLADSGEIAAAADAGAQALTHLGNGVPGMVPRHRNPIWAGLAEERLAAMIITDGHHLPPELIRVICKVKGAAKIIVTSDASPGAGLPPGPCRVFGSDAILEPGGRLYNPATGYLAGSAVMLAECMRRLESLGIFSEAELRMAGRDNALKLIGPA
ncbi:MAG: N-acetylglucosamine-6-phosphate deacetylase [Lentisphaeria bacterium]|nr:N-acetylglucosamine-6-phosphate deacetylase [Lentisphaeria bacterium]MBS5529535.1 N-acetylglucosamine-6-phosphate deacetylase [bacterium]